MPPSRPAPTDPNFEDGRPDRNPGPLPWEKGLSLDEGVLWMIADGAGLDGEALVRMGLKRPQAAQPVLQLLRAAAQASSAAQRRRLA